MADSDPEEVALAIASGLRGPDAAKATASGAITLTWNDMAYSIKDKKAPDGRKAILQPQSGEVCPGDLVALMGPSGSGKTSVLNALANRLPIQSGASFSGDIRVNGLPLSELPCPFADISAYVEQEDVLYALSNVQETLDFAARLRLPTSFSASERTERIEEVLRQLGLLHVRNTNVGGSSFNGALRGLSGGERKRLSIALELLHRPKAIFLDEPTTGLDSYQALNVMEKLRALAADGHTVMVSIHQPRSSIFAMLTGVYLLAGGTPVYAGSAEAAADHFEKLGYQLPPKFNPADFLIDLVSVDQRDPEAKSSTQTRLEALVDAWKGCSGIVDKTGRDDMSAELQKKQVMDAKSVSPGGQIAFFSPLFLLLKRGWREQMRDKASLLFKTFFQMFFAGIFGFVYFRLGTSQTNIQDRSGLLFFLTMNQAFGAVIGCSQVIPRQLVVVNRERANRLYSVVPFYLSSLMVMMPIEALPQLMNNAILYFLTNLQGSFWIFFCAMCFENFVGISLGMMLSASFKNVQMASQLAPAVVILFLIFSGFLVNEDSVPVYFIWLREISFIRYAFKAVMVNEFKGASFQCDPSDPVCISSGDQVLAKLGFDSEGLILQCFGFLGAMFCVFNVAAFLILLARRPRFLPLRPPSDEAKTAATAGV